MTSLRAIKLIGISFFLFLLIFTRFYNIDHTARFTQDESHDLLGTRQLILKPKLTLVGPISNDNTKVFGSLTYYMLLPFVILGHSEPISPVWGAAFWGIIAACILVVLTIRLHKKFLVVIAPLVLLWFPLLETSRWSWNPHFVLVWIFLGILCLCWEKPIPWFLGGVFLAVSIHNHYIALFATSVFVALEAFRSLRSRRFHQVIALVLGYFLPFVPFLLFDLRHWPGLFLVHYLLGGHTPNTVPLTLSSAFARIIHAGILSFHYMAPIYGGALLLGGMSLLLIIFDVKHRSRTLIWILPILIQLSVAAILDDYQTRYFLPAIPFFLAWLIDKRRGFGKLIAAGILVFLVGVSLFTVIPQLTQTTVPPDIYSLTKASKTIARVVKDPRNHVMNPNVAVLQSPDTGVLAEKYRDVLSIYGISMRAPSEYNVSENLFVITTASSEAQLRADGAYALKPFKAAAVHGIYTIKNSPWKVFWFSF